MFCIYINCSSGPKKEARFMFWKEGGGYRCTKGAEDQAGVFPLVKFPSVRGINSLVAHDIGCAIRSLLGMRATTFYDLDQDENWKVWNALSVSN